MNMKRLIFISILALSVSSCATYKAAYDLVLSGAWDAVDARTPDGKVVEVDLGGEVHSGLVYTDRIIGAAWAFSQTEFELLLENRTDHSIRILWDGAVFVGPEGTCEPLVSGGVTVADRFNAQKPTVIPAGAAVSEQLLVPGRVYYDEHLRTWKTSSLLPTEFATRKDLMETAPAMCGKTVKVLLPVECEGVIYEYLFSFTVDSVSEIAPVDNVDYSYFEWEQREKPKKANKSKKD